MSSAAGVPGASAGSDCKMKWSAVYQSVLQTGCNHRIEVTPYFQRCLCNAELIGVSFRPLLTTNPEKKRSWYCITELDTVPLVAAVCVPAGLESSMGGQKRSDRLFIQLVLSE